MAKMGRRVKSAGAGPSGDRTQLIMIAVVGVLVVAGIGYAFSSGLIKPPRSAERDYEIRVSEGLGLIGSAHTHTDFAVFADRTEPVNFGASQYEVRAQHVHVEGGDGDVVHNHATGVRVGYFLHTLGMRLTDDSFIVDQSKAYRNGGGKEIQVWVQGFEPGGPVACSERQRIDQNPDGEATRNNWTLVTAGSDLYVMKSRDRILVTYIDTTDPAAYLAELKREQGQVTVKACGANLDGET